MPGRMEMDVHFFDFLPVELISLVLAQREVHFEDVAHFGATCKRYRELTKDNELWKMKLLTRWPCLQRPAEFLEPPVDWFHQCRSLHRVSQQVYGLLAGLSARCFHKQEFCYSHLAPLEDLSQQSELCRELLRKKLMNTVDDEDRHKDLTVKYYAAKALQRTTHVNLTRSWVNLMSAPIKEQNLLEGAILLEEWYNSLVVSPRLYILEEVNKIANQVRKKLVTSHPSHAEGINGVVVEMTPAQYHQVFDAINEVLYKEMKFRGNVDDFYNVRNSLMSSVLSRRLGIPITLSILYEAVARHLGILLKPVSFPRHFILCWNQSPEYVTTLLDMINDCQFDSLQFIDAFNNGKLMSSAELLVQHRFNTQFLKPCEPSKVFLRMVENVINLTARSSEAIFRDCAELKVVLNPEDFQTVMTCVEMYLRNDVNLTLSSDLLREIRPQTQMELTEVTTFKGMVQRSILRENEDKGLLVPAVKRRCHNPQVVHSAGMIMRHRQYHYECVIHGWDQSCTLSSDWQSQMGIQHLPNGAVQPFYHVMVSDSSNRYVAQDNMESIAAPVVVTHPTVGKYFKEFTGKCYIPNDELAARYPDDAAVTLEKTAEIYKDL